MLRVRYAGLEGAWVKRGGSDVQHVSLPEPLGGWGRGGGGAVVELPRLPGAAVNTA